MPAVLVECGFMSNSDDRASLITDKGKDKIASDHYDAFRKYKEEYDGVDSPVRQEQPAVNETKEEPKEEPVVAAPSEGPVYAIQVLATSRQMRQDDPFFKGEEFRRLPAGKIFKYVIGCSSDLEDVRKFYDVHKSDFPDSFIVKIEDDKTTRIQ